MNLPPLAPRHEKPDRKCATCEFFVHAGPGSDVGSCHRNAPLPTVDYQQGGGLLMAYWPDVALDDFCGEWSQK